ncbi:unnamed protein product [Durusdinium trenchii]|uniref:Uncharacterized protein n=1 Tax=Durusdinium trenchii TaxID=1381693 RepID=A0ABP0IQ26_9DINO
MAEPSADTWDTWQVAEVAEPGADTWDTWQVAEVAQPSADSWEGWPADATTASAEANAWSTTSTAPANASTHTSKSGAWWTGEAHTHRSGYGADRRNGYRSGSQHRNRNRDWTSETGTARSWRKDATAQTWESWSAPRERDTQGEAWHNGTSRSHRDRDNGTSRRAPSRPRTREWDGSSWHGNRWQADDKSDWNEHHGRNDERDWHAQQQNYSSRDDGRSRQWDEWNAPAVREEAAKSWWDTPSQNHTASREGAWGGEQRRARDERGDRWKPQSWETRDTWQEDWHFNRARPTPTHDKARDNWDSWNGRAAGATLPDRAWTTPSTWGEQRSSQRQEWHSDGGRGGTQGWSEWSAAEEAGKVEPWKKWAPEAAPEAPMQSDWGAWSVDEPKSTEELWANWKPQAAPQAPQAVETWTQWGSACPQADAHPSAMRPVLHFQ